MSGIDYYAISGQIVPQKTTPNDKCETVLEMPTAPMYRDLDTYNGRCAIWLKYVGLSPVNATQTLVIRQFLRGFTPIFTIRGCPSLNQIALKNNRGLNYANGNSSLNIAVGDRGITRGGFKDATFICPFNINHLESGAGAGGGLETGDFYNQVASNANGGAAGGSGDGTGANAPAHTILLDNAKYFTDYYNTNVGNMGDAVITDNLWGSSKTFCLEGLTKGLFHAGIITPFNAYDGDINFEIVIKPLKNEAIYRGLPEDDKNRQKY